MTDRLKNSMPPKTPFRRGYIQVFSIAKTMNMPGNKFVLLMFGKFPFLLSWKKHFLFIRYKSITCTVISVNGPLIIRYISGKRAFYPLHVRYSCGHCVASTLHTPIVSA